MNNKTSPFGVSGKNATSTFKDLRGWHVAIRTTQYQELIKWYEDKLDFRLLKEFTSGEMLLALIAPSGDDNFVIEVLGVKQTAAVENTGVKSGYDHVCFNVEDLDKTLEALNCRGIEVDRLFDAPAIGKRVAFIIDSFGNTIEFAEYLKVN